MVPLPSLSYVLKSASISSLEAHPLPISSCIPLRNSATSTKPLSSSSHARKRSMTRTLFLASMRLSWPWSVSGLPSWSVFTPKPRFRTRLRWTGVSIGCSRSIKRPSRSFGIWPRRAFSSRTSVTSASTSCTSFAFSFIWISRPMMYILLISLLTWALSSKLYCVLSSSLIFALSSRISFCLIRMVVCSSSLVFWSNPLATTLCCCISTLASFSRDLVSATSSFSLFTSPWRASSRSAAAFSISAIFSSTRRSARSLALMVRASDSSIFS
mmetsp:Transcript_35520/g.80666  ORF Transcript_35520/g.80666 Transcript_35520/m.80666 type:complete len:270 (-) Transcript_35520:550-1359(-)